MKREELLVMVEDFKEVRKSISSGEISIEDMRNGLELAQTGILEGFEILVKIINKEEIEKVSLQEQMTILESIEEEMAKYEKKQHKKDIKMVLKIIDKVDRDIGEELFLPFMISILEYSAKSLALINKDIEKTTRKVIKKFLKKRKSKLEDK